MPIVLDQLVKIMPNAGTSGRAAQWIDPLNGAMTRFEISSSPRMAMFLANIAVETGELRSRVESLRYSGARLREVFGSMFAGRPELADQLAAQGEEAIGNFIYADKNRSPSGRLGNVNEGDGFKYRGRGPLQITGRSNYARFFRDVGMSEDSDPVFLEQPEGGAVAAAHYWKTRGCNQTADAGDFDGCVRKINPGMIDLEKRRNFHAAAQAALD
jgi:putative chitinase